MNKGIDFKAIRASLREEVCAECHRRPVGSESLPPDVARACEAACPLFAHLPRLAALVQRFGGEPPCGYEIAFESLIGHACPDEGAHGISGGGTFGGGTGRCRGGRAADQCTFSLARYAPTALAVVERITTRGVRKLR